MGGNLWNCRGFEAGAEVLWAAQYAYLVVEATLDKGIQYLTPAFYNDALQFALIELVQHF